MRDAYRGVLGVLLVSGIAGSVCALILDSFVDNVLLLDVAVAFGLAAGCLFGVAQSRRPRPAVDPAPSSEAEDLPPKERLAFVSYTRSWIDQRGNVGAVAVVVGSGGLLALMLEWTRDTRYDPLSFVHAIVGAAACAGGAALVATAVQYLQAIDPAGLPDGPALARAGRVLAWMLVGAGISMGLLWARQATAVRVVHTAAMLINAAVCGGLLAAKPAERDGPQTFPVDLGVLSVLGSRPNIAASVLDSAEQQLGIDLRSTWALAVVRQSLEPLAIALFAIGWLSTSLTIVGVDEEALVERLGVPVAGPALQPGLHVHWPWPVDSALRIPVHRVQALSVGHEGEERGGPEDVLWAQEHAANEYTLLLGNGRDLITVDAAVQFRIRDPRAWHYRSQNPSEALKAIAYRAVMRTTVNRTLTEALSENVVTTTSRMRAMMQQDADALGLGVEVLDFTVGGMHPPVPVAPAYQAVVSAEVGKTTAIVDAQAFRNRTVPGAQTIALASLNRALADSVTALSLGTGEAASFLMLQSQYRSSPEEYMFRRRLEALEEALADRRFTIVDGRFQRDGGELWVRP